MGKYVYFIFSSGPKFAQWEFRLQFFGDSSKVGGLLLIQLVFGILIACAFLWWKSEMLHLLTVVAEKMKYKFWNKKVIN